ncbi:MAG: 16S rRNA (adenine(1518)-N(6)/adenine(1519)-N(6))-dimethyltransferase RsmA [Desulfonatronovibrionaceae bacterium]
MHRPKKSLGQNFLIDRNICSKIASCIDIQRLDRVVEIGPGKGALTEHIAGCTDRLLVLEKDFSLCRELKARFPGLAVINTDVLDWDWTRMPGSERLKILGNLPYNIASRILWDLAGQHQVLDSAVFMVQKEVARRIVSRPGGKTYGMLSVWLQSHFEVRIMFCVSPRVFRPVPGVDSAVVGFFRKMDKKIFWGPSLEKLLKMMFQQRRKQVRKILSSYWNDDLNLFFRHKGIQPQARPETLDPEVFQQLSGLIYPENQ